MYKYQKILLNILCPSLGEFWGFPLFFSMFFSYVFFLQFAYINFTVRINNKDIFIFEKIISDLPEQKTFFFSPQKRASDIGKHCRQTLSLVFGKSGTFSSKLCFHGNWLLNYGTLNIKTSFLFYKITRLLRQM